MPIRKLPNSSSEIKQNKRSDSTGHSEIPTQRNIKYQIYAHIISRFSMSGAHRTGSDHSIPRVMLGLLKERDALMGPGR